MFKCYCDLCASSRRRALKIIKGERYVCNFVFINYVISQIVKKKNATACSLHRQVTGTTVLGSL